MAAMLSMLTSVRCMVDLDASLHGAVLPLTGMYLIHAATSRGAGDYRLHFTVTSMAPTADGARITPFSDAFATVPVNGSICQPTTAPDQAPKTVVEWWFQLKSG